MFVVLARLCPLSTFRLVLVVRSCMLRVRFTGLSWRGCCVCYAGVVASCTIRGRVDQSGVAVPVRVRRNRRVMLPVRLMSFHSELTAVRPVRGEPGDAAVVFDLAESGFDGGGSASVGLFAPGGV